MRAFQRLTHHGGVADTFEGIVGTAACQVDKMPDKVITMVGRVDEMGHAETLAPFLLVIVQIDADDHVRADHPQALNDIQADAAKAEDHGVASCLCLGRIDHRANAGGHAAPI